MKYERIRIGSFLRRPNRFIAHAMLENEEIIAHVKNTGRCGELLLDNAEVSLQKADNPSRKTKWDLIAVFKPALGWVNIDSQVCNSLFAEVLKSKKIPYKAEVTKGNSRFDFCLYPDQKPFYMEVKGCNLEIDHKGYFPDAPTQRGCRHVKELTMLKKSGIDCGICFVITMDHISHVHPKADTDREFAHALKEARQAGVRIFHAQCTIGPDCAHIIKIREEKLLF